MRGPSYIVAGAGLFLSLAAAPVRTWTPDEWREAVEADWARQEALRLRPARPATVEDAAGGVDGVKDGRWGFHTEHEADPWWQVDLGAALPLGRIVLYNRCDAGMAERNDHILVLLSDDGRGFRRAYRHEGPTFHGVTGGPPLSVELRGETARFVRLALEGKSYFHLDEVEIHGPDGTNNLAFRRPATQSSTSQWSAVHPLASEAPTDPAVLATSVERGLRLAADLARRGADTAGAAEELRGIARAAGGPGGGMELRAALLRARRIVRRLALSDPLLDFDSILFVKRAPGMFPHMSDQHYGWWSRPGGGLFVLEGFRGDAPRVRCLTADLPPGSVTGPDVSPDGRRIAFAWCRFVPGLAEERDKADKSRVPEDAFYHVFVMNADGSDRRQVTHGRYDDFDPRWLPDGRLLFLSTRKGLAVPCSAARSDATRAADLPDSYVRCGGDDYRPVPVFTLHAMNPDGTGLRPLSAFENFEWTPSLACDGRILFARWDYIDRFNGPFISLWSQNPDGGNPQLVYGNYTKCPQTVFEPRAVPGSRKVVFTAGAHHSITGGSLCLLDRTRGTEEEAPLTLLTPEVCFPETGGWPEHYFANPWPLSEEHFLVAWADRKLPPHCRCTDEQNPANAAGIYLYDAFGNLELLHRDPDISSGYPMPLAPRPCPPEVAAAAPQDPPATGRFVVQDVGRGLDGLPRGVVRRLRIVAVVPKTQPHMNRPVLGVSKEEPGKFVVGTVPVEADGSAHFRAPAGIPLFFQALDERGLAVQTMRSLTHLAPGQALSCIGCHEDRDRAPDASARALLASARPPSWPAPGPDGSWPLRFDRLVQPVLDRRCVQCHRPEAPGFAAPRPDLTPARAWESLLAAAGGDLRRRVLERDRSIPGECAAANSRLWALLTGGQGHHDVRLDGAERERLATWMDTYGHLVGHFDDRQEQELATFREQWSARSAAAPPPP